MPCGKTKLYKKLIKKYGEKRGKHIYRAITERKGYSGRRKK